MIFAPAAAQTRTIIRVPEDYTSISEALVHAPDGAVIEIAAGDYLESLQITRPVQLTAREGDTVILTGRDDHKPVIEIENTQNVTIMHLTIRGGTHGILVWRSLEVSIHNNVIEGSSLVGIKVRMATARITGNIIRDTLPPYAHGIHVTNTMDQPLTLIQGNTIINNPRSGVLTNMAMTIVSDNTVRDNGQRGIAITEMSDGLVARNLVENNAENGIYISDSSTVTVCNNTVMGSELPEMGDSGRYGNGITVDYQSEAELINNVVRDNANHGVVGMESSRLLMRGNIIEANGAQSLWLDATSRQQSTLTVPRGCTR